MPCVFQPKGPLIRGSRDQRCAPLTEVDTEAGGWWPARILMWVCGPTPPPKPGVSLQGNALHSPRMLTSQCGWAHRRAAMGSIPIWRGNKEGGGLGQAASQAVIPTSGWSRPPAQTPCAGASDGQQSSDFDPQRHFGEQPSFWCQAAAPIGSYIYRWEN